MKKINTAVLVLLFSFWSNLALASNIPKDELSQEILSRISRVDSFDFIAKEAQRLGVRAYLFGGSAAAYAHYVHWDLMRESGDTRFHADRFTYAYVDIFRSNQDMDIVIDGPEEAARALERLLAERFPFFQGNKSVWEVRLLKTARGDKEALLNNPDFMNQHTDSNSTGLIELSTHPEQAQIRDLRDWAHIRDSQFIIDVQEQKLHYYYSELHSTTSRFKQDMNPPILSVIRYLTKAFQYELEVDLEKPHLQEIIDQFEYDQIQNSYVKKWLNNNGKKLYQNAVNLEYASQVLDELGLKQKLQKVGDQKNSNDLAWWMYKEPLKSRPLGQGTGVTASELGLTVVAHETNSFAAWESIVKSHENVPNVFVSRQGGAGESASYGDGFYTRVGRQGARNTGITIRFKLHPEARLGTDFEFERGSQYVIVKNKQALEVIHEDLSWTPKEYFEKLMSGFEFDSSDKAVMYKLKQKIMKRVALLSPAEVHELYQLVNPYFDQPSKNNVTVFFQEWLGSHFDPKYDPSPLQYMKALAAGLKTDQIPEADLARYLSGVKAHLARLSPRELAALDSQVEYHFKNISGIRTFQHKTPGMIQHLIDEGADQVLMHLLEYEFLKPYTGDAPEILWPFLEKAESNFYRTLFMRIFPNPSLDIRPGLIEFTIKHADLHTLSLMGHHSFLTPHALNNWQAQIKLYIKHADDRGLSAIVYSTFSKPQTAHLSEHLKLIIEKADHFTMNKLVDQVFNKERGGPVHEMLSLMVEKADLKILDIMAQVTFSKKFHQHRYDLIKRLIERGDQTVLRTMSRHVFYGEAINGMHELIKMAIFKADQITLQSIAEHTCARPELKDASELIRLVIEHGNEEVYRKLALKVFTKAHTVYLEELLILLMKKSNYGTHQIIAEKVFHEPHTASMDKSLRTLIELGHQNILEYLAIHAFSQPHTKHLPELLRLLIENGGTTAHMMIADHVFSRPHTSQMHAELRYFIEQVDAEVLRIMAIKTFSRPHFETMEEFIILAIKKADGRTLVNLSNYTFSQPHTAQMKTALGLLIAKADDHLLSELAVNTFSKPHTRGMQALLRVLIERGGGATLNALARYTFSQPHTFDMHELVQLLMRKADLGTLQILRNSLSERHMPELKRVLMTLESLPRNSWQEYVRLQISKLPGTGPGSSCLRDKLMDNQ